jgi:hypothetical protein
MLGLRESGVPVEVALPIAGVIAFSPLVAWIIVYLTREAKRQGWVPSQA